MTRLGREAAALALATMTMIGACAQGSADTHTPLGVVGLDSLETSLQQAQPRGIYFVTEPEARSLRFGPGPRRRVIYMNKNGGTYTPGNNDNSVTNVSIVPNQTSQLSAWSYGDVAWAQLMGCVKLQYARFDVQITDVEPSSQSTYIESAVGGTPQQMGLPDGVGGVAPVAGDCSTVERAVAFTFSGVYGGDIQAICETVAQETSHAFGLDHEFLCQDPMTYLRDCGAKTFQDQAAPCGEDTGPRTCRCGDATQNSVQALLQVLGPADAVAPTLSITDPADGATVAAGFAVAVDANDNVGVTKVELFIDDALVTNDASAPYQFAAPAALTAGSHTVEVRAYDAAGGLSKATVTVALAGSAPPGTGGDPPADNPGSTPGTDTPADDGTGGAITGGCSAAPSGTSSRSAGAPLVLLLAAALILGFRRRA